MYRTQGVRPHMSRSKPLIIHVIGRSGSGKTTTIEYLTTHLTGHGLNVAVIKHVHHEGFSFDTEGKDTWRHARAGASIVVGVAPHELAIFKQSQKETTVHTALDALRSEKLNLILVEGFSRERLAKRSPKILTARNARELTQMLKISSAPIIGIAGPIAASKGVTKIRMAPAPIFDIRSDDCMLLTIVRKMLRPK
jgi:molybdopterin-guanine dinucleotide biosynthesis protein MobB